MTGLWCVLSWLLKGISPSIRIAIGDRRQSPAFPDDKKRGHVQRRERGFGGRAFSGGAWPMLQETRTMFQRVRESGIVPPFSHCPPACGGGTPPPTAAPCGPDRTVCIRKAVVQLCCAVKDVPRVKKFFQEKRKKRLTERGRFDRPLFAPTSAFFPGGSIGRAGDC